MALKDKVVTYHMEPELSLGTGTDPVWGSCVGCPFMPILSLPQAVPPWHCAAMASASTCSSAWQG